VTPHALIAPARLAGASLMRAQSDDRLVDLVRAGNDAAFEAIVSRHRRPLQRYCARFLSESRAEDAVQQTFLSAYSSLRASSGEMNLRAWLFRIGHNTSLNMLRDRGATHEQLSEEIDGVERPDQVAERSERLRDTVTAVRALPDRQRDAILLREMEGRSYEDIAVTLGVTGGAVRQLLSRARTTLQAGATAVTPQALAARVPWSAAPSQGVAERIGELCTAGAGGALAAKACATVIVTGAVVGGVASAPSGDPQDSAAARDRSPPAVRPAPSRAGPAGSQGLPGTRRQGPTAGQGSGRGKGPGANARRREDRRGSNRKRGSRGGTDDRRGPSRDDEHSRSGDSGPGSGDRAEAPGRGGPDPSGSDDSGSGSRGPGPGLSGSGDSASGSGSNGPGSGSGSSGPGSGSESGSGDSDRYRSGSGSSEGSSGSGSGNEFPRLDG